MLEPLLRNIVKRKRKCTAVNWFYLYNMKWTLVGFMWAWVDKSVTFWIFRFLFWVDSCQILEKVHRLVCVDNQWKQTSVFILTKMKKKENSMCSSTIVFYGKYHHFPTEVAIRTSHDSVVSIFHYHLDIAKLSFRWVPHLLIMDHERNRLTTSKGCLP